MRLTKVFGPPGTGKTTYLLKVVEDAMAAGIKPERIAFMAFTRKAATEAITRAKERFGFAEDRLPWFRTLHSMAFRDVMARRDDIMQEEHYRELGRALSFEFTSIDDEYTFLPLGTALGDKVGRIEALARVREVSLEEQWEKENYRDVPFSAVRQWTEALRDYKQSRGLLDYTDLLEQFNSELEVDLFIVDEAQDLSPLQWKVVRKASALAKDIYVAGDDDQCIYDWAGADVRKFLRLKGRLEVLPISYRLPSRVHHMAEGISSRIEERQAKKWRGKEEAGHIERIMYEQHLELEKGEWMLLARNHATLQRYVTVLENRGYPYIKEGRHSTDNATTKAILSWEHWRKGNPLKPSEVRSIQKHMPELERWSPKEEVYLEDAPLPAGLKQMNWMDALRIDPRRREYIRACLANRESLLGKPRITVSTIHRVKGGEAENVVLIPDLSAKPWSQLNTDSEQRVLYVAVTRTKQRLVIIQPQSQRHYQI